VSGHDRRSRGTGFREDVDFPSGTIRVAGRLTEHGGDLIEEAVESLRRSGHLRITVDLREVRGADDAGLAALRSLMTPRWTRSGDPLVLSVENLPEESER
jgi:anti-anti-sigma regulatory factor